jgi:hypothetical protein
MRDILRVSTQEYQQIVDYLKSNSTIKAIKFLRGIIPNGSLKEAKWAIDLLKSELLHGQQGVAHINADVNAKKIVCGPSILSLTLDYGQGPVKLDIEGMQLHALTELHTIGIEACIHMLHLVDIFKAISDGKDVKVIEKN